MSVGAVFKLIANDGKADRMIMATKLLNQRIKDVMCARSAAGKADITPTLTDLERTHILYVNSHFKPFAAIGYEYNKVRPQSSNAQLGTGVTFSIPQFGDFFHDMVCRVRLSPCAATYQQTPLQGITKGPNGEFVFPNNEVLQGKVTKYAIVDAFGNTLVSQINYSAAPYQVGYQNFVRYCEFPGNRLFRWVKFDVNGNPLDSYDEMVPVMLEKFCTPPHKRTGYNRLVGQENPLTGYSGLNCALVTDQDVVNTPAGVITRMSSEQSNQTVALYQLAQLVSATPNLSSADPSVRLAPIGFTGAPTVVNSPVIPLNNSKPLSGFQNQYDVSRKRLDVMNGPQTPKPMQAPLEIWNKLRFWFNDDVRLSVPSVAIPFGQRFITIDLTAAQNLVYEFPSIYLEKTLDQVDANNNLQLRTKTYSPIMQPSAIIQPSSTNGGAAGRTYGVEQIELYINNIFVNPEVHDIFIKRIGFSLIRVYRQQWQTTDSEAGEILLSQLKWPIEYMFVGMRPKWNINPQNTNIWRDWHRLTRLVDATTTTNPYMPEGRQELPLAMTIAEGACVTEIPFCNIGSYINPVIPEQYWLPVPTVDSMALTSHGIVIFDNYADQFFNSYMPFHYGGTALCTPDDPGALFINMALFPRSYQPSGHLNVSRARETYIKWHSTYISTTTPTELIIVGVALNFLLITDGSAVLRYST
jgi:hypothetical protein